MVRKNFFLLPPGEGTDSRTSFSDSLLALLDRYGATELQAAIQEALQRGVPHPNAVRMALERRREARELPPPVEMALPSYVQERDTPVQAHKLESYDQITEVSDDPD